MTIVNAQPAAPHGVGIIASARTSLDAEEGWERGMEWAPEACGGYRALSDCTTATLEQDVDNRPGPMDYQPWTLKVEEECGTIGGDASDLVDARLRRQLQAVESYAIGRELMTGELTRAEVAEGAYATPNLYLANAETTTVLTTGPVKPHLGMGILEEALGHALKGQLAYLHLPLIGAPRGPSVRPDGNMRRTLRDNQVVLEAGYVNVAPTAPGEDPAPAAAGTVWWYGTGLVVVRRGTPFQDAPERYASTTDARRNLTSRSMAKRVAAHFDPCAQFAVQITLED